MDTWYSEGGEKMPNVEQFQNSVCSWCPPDDGNIKINTDVVIFNDAGSRGFGLMARDSRGKFQGGGSIKSDIILSPIMMEARGVFEGMRFAISRGWKLVIIESDC